MLNGRKRWIGNATFADIVVVWARNLDTQQINAFIVRKGTPGFRTTKIENKIALRCVQNANICLDDCFVRDEDRLPGVDNFQVHPFNLDYESSPSRTVPGSISCLLEILAKERQ